MVSYVICDRIIDEVRGWRCDLSHGHAGKCRTMQQPDPTPAEVNERFGAMLAKERGL